MGCRFGGGWVACHEDANKTGNVCVYINSKCYHMLH